MAIDFVNLSYSEQEAYFNDPRQSLRDVRGIQILDFDSKKTRLEDQNNVITEVPLFQKALDDFISRNNIPLTKKVLELGGAIGVHAKYALSKNIKWNVLDTCQWCFDNKLIPDANFIKADAKTYLETLRNNEYDYIVSFNFLDCYSKADLPSLITEINRVGKKQIHIVSEKGDQLDYIIEDLDFWKLQGFKTGTILIGREQNLNHIVVV